MKSVSISGSPRVNVGKKDAKELRKQGFVPCVLYGGKEQVHFSAPESDFKKLIYSPDVYTIKLDVGGKQFDAVLQEVQFHKVSDNLLHVDFLEIIKDKPVILNIPVKTVGTAVGVRAGGKLLKKLKTLKVRGPVENLPDYITLNVESLEIGDSIRVEDVKQEGLQLLDAPNVTVVSVQVTRAVVDDKPGAPAAGAPAAAAAAPAAEAAKKEPAKKEPAKK